MIPDNQAFVGVSLETQAVVIAPGLNGLNVITSNRGTAQIGGPVVGVSVVCQGSNTFNSTTTSGFFQVTNNSPLDVVGVQFDWVASSNPAQSTMVFDTDQTGMADRFDGGNSTASGCLGTYRNGSDVTTGLDYPVSPASPCDPTALSGWIGSNVSGTSFRTIDFAFTGFNPGEMFEVDIDTDGGAGIGGDDMAGMVVTVLLSDGRRLIGEVQAIAPDLGRVDL